jgi:hypothetical protein
MLVLLGYPVPVFLIRFSGGWGRSGKGRGSGSAVAASKRKDTTGRDIDGDAGEAEHHPG